jgi:rare lipoprotein A
MKIGNKINMLSIKKIAVLALAVSLSIAAIEPALANPRFVPLVVNTFFHQLFEVKKPFRPRHHRPRSHHVVKIVSPVHKPPMHITPVTANSGYSECGKASWYSLPRNRTASGSMMNPAAMEVAHKYLPFGTLIKIVNNDNGRIIQATVTDRGPFIHGRIVDLTWAAKTRLGVDGLANVCIAKL